MPPRPQRLRLDHLLVQRGLAPDLKKAQALVMAGQVLVNEQKTTLPATLLDPEVALRLKGVRRFVSRGGEKLAGAVDRLQLAAEFSGAIVLDLGASTGGFTDCSLQLGAAKVYAVDIGRNLLDYRLTKDPRVQDHSGVDILRLEPLAYADVGLVVADISFVGLQDLLPTITKCVPKTAGFLLLVKPQFELEPSAVPKGGVVRDEAERQRALTNVAAALADLGLHVIASCDSPLPGRRGNREIFCWARHL